jgi:hypothetical protein
MGKIKYDLIIDDIRLTNWEVMVLARGAIVVYDDEKIIYPDGNKWLSLTH